MPSEYLPYREIASQLGLRKGDILLMASDLTRLAFMARRKEGAFDINLFIDSFIDVLGEEGTLLIPAYNFNLAKKSVFDIKKSKPVTGAMSEAAFMREDFYRTAQPLHSFMVKGKYRNELCNLKNTSSFGPDSPFAFLYKHNAKMLMAGTSVAEAFTFVHFVEEREKVWYRKMQKYRICYSGAGEQATERTYYLYAKKAGWTMKLEKLEELLKEKQVVNSSKIDGLEFEIISAADAFPVIQRDILENNAGSIAAFDLKLLFKDFIKNLSRKSGLYKTTSDKIKYDTGLHP